MSDRVDPLSSARFVITGPTGWIGQALLHWLSEELGTDLAKQVDLYGSRASTICGPYGTLDVKPLREIDGSALDSALVYHLAYLTRDKLTTTETAHYAQANLAIDDILLAACKTRKPRGMFVASSGAATQVASGKTKDLYGMLKLYQEERFTEASRNERFALYKARIYNIAGPYGNKHSIYALASFISQGLANGRIEISARVPVYRSYVHVLDLLRVATAEILTNGNIEQTVEVAGREIVELSDVAQAVADEIGLDDQAVYRAALSQEESNIYVGQPYLFSNSALKHRIGLRGFREQVADTVRFMRSYIV